MSTPRHLVDRVTRFRDRVLDRVLAVNAKTEGAVLRAGDCLRRIVELARGHVDATQQLGVYANRDTRGGLHEAVARQSDSVAEHTRTLGELIGKQRRLAEAALSHVEAIKRSEQDIGSLVSASRLLALNAQIEAARLGHDGRSFGIVAEEMKKLSQQIAKANARIGELATEMCAALPTMATQAETIEQRAADFAGRQREHAEEVDRGIATLERTITEVVTTGAAAIQTILSTSHDALSELQFQDVVAQSLGAIDAEGFTLERELCDSLGVAGRAIRPPAQANLGGTDDSRAVAQSGDVIMF